MFSNAALPQVTEALSSDDLRPPHVPFELLQLLAQSPAVLADLRATLTGTGDMVNSAGPGSQVYWTARLSATVAAQQEGAAASSSSTGNEQPQGLRTTRNTLQGSLLTHWDALRPESVLHEVDVQAVEHQCVRS